MTTPATGLRQAAATALLAPALMLLAAALSKPASAQNTAAEDATTFPEPGVFREIQLKTMACGRENRNEPCQQARAMADPLMDHPKLPASCKDALWSILEKATVAPSNSYTRREALNKDATDVTSRCKPATKPVGSSGGSGKPEEKRSGGGLGGFLRGLGIGGQSK